MKVISEKLAVQKLAKVRANLKSRVAGYEAKAASCATCPTPGACCLDAHFVNVRISRLEAVAIRGVLDTLDGELRGVVKRRIEETVTRYNLLPNSSIEQTYACPLFEKGVGCLVHNTAKPLPCIAHACYALPDDLPPDEILDRAEIAADALNRQTYGSNHRWLPLPVALA